MLKLLEKHGINYDIGIHNKNLWQTILDGGKYKHTLVLPSTLGSCKVVKLSGEKIKETF